MRRIIFSLNKYSPRRALLFLLVFALLIFNFGFLVLAEFFTVEPKLKVHFLDVGQGDAIFIETPAKKQILIDGGANRAVLTGLGNSMRFWDRSLDLVIATHPDQDHIGGLFEVINRYDISLIVDNGESSSTLIYQSYRQAQENENAYYKIAKPGQIIDFGDGVKLIILESGAGQDSNDGSVVVRLEYGQTSFFLGGDASVVIEDDLANNYPNLVEVDVLKAGHHGSRTSTSLFFLERVRPTYTVISAGANNRYGHPHRDVIANLLTTETKILQTAERGTITFMSDGREIFVK